MDEVSIKERDMKKVMQNADGSLIFMVFSDQAGEWVGVLTGPLWGTKGLWEEFPELGYAQRVDNPGCTPWLNAKVGTMPGMITARSSDGTVTLFVGVDGELDPARERGGWIERPYRRHYTLRQWSEAGAVEVNLNDL